MKNNWSNCQNILCVRVDNMGDVMMSSPAIRALKSSFSCKLTLLTSPKGEKLARLFPFVDDVIACNAPWVKSEQNDEVQDFLNLVERLRELKFDACVIFTVYSQNPMPAIMLAYLAGIPLRLSYCRENPYELLSDWVPDQEPYSLIKHQVQRDLDLVQQIGASTTDTAYRVQFNKAAEDSVTEKLKEKGVHGPFLVFHCGVSEPKRQYPDQLWVASAKLTLAQLGIPILFTGTMEEIDYVANIQQQVGGNSLSVAGLFSLEEFIYLLKEASAVVSVNTSTIHLCSAVQTPVTVLYAQTNPQHTPWDVKYTLLEYSIPEEYKSKNEVIGYVDRHLYREKVDYPSPEKVLGSIKGLLSISLNTA